MPAHHLPGSSCSGSIQVYVERIQPIQANHVYRRDRTVSRVFQQRWLRKKQVIVGSNNYFLQICIYKFTFMLIQEKETIYAMLARGSMIIEIHD